MFLRLRGGQSQGRGLGSREGLGLEEGWGWGVRDGGLHGKGERVVETTVLA